MEVCEIATASAGDQDLFARAIGAFKDCDAPAAFACFDRAHQASRPGAQYYRIEFVDHDREEALTANSAANDYCILLICLGRRSLFQTLVTVTPYRVSISSSCSSTCIQNIPKNGRS
jgi:hypothetical protein